MCAHTYSFLQMGETEVQSDQLRDLLEAESLVRSESRAKVVSPGPCVVGVLIM